MLLESLRGKDGSIDLREKDALIKHNPAVFWTFVILHKENITSFIQHLTNFDQIGRFQAVKISIFIQFNTACRFSRCYAESNGWPISILVE